MKTLWRWIEAVARWLGEPWRLWITLGVVVAVALVSTQFPGSVDDRVRYSGLVLELLGILTVAFGLRDKRRLFNRPSILDHARSWLRRRPRWGAQPQTISLSGSANLSISASGRLSAWGVAAPGASLEARLAALEANVETLRTEQTETAKQLQEEARKRVAAVDSERQAREPVANKLRTQLDTLGAGGLHLERTGLFWLILGVILATASTEIAGALKWVQ